MVALLNGLTGELVADAGPWLDGTGPDEPALRRSLTALAALWSSHGRLLAGALAAAPGCPPIAEWRAGMRSAYVDRLAARIERDRAAGLAPDGLEVSLIPETLERTTLGELTEGSEVNVEVDVVARYTERLLQGFNEERSED